MTTPRWMTPAQLEADCEGWTLGAVLVVGASYIMRPDTKGRRKLEKRAPDGIRNSERLPQIIATYAERWLGMIAGSALTAGDTTTEDTGIASTVFLDQYGRKFCKINTQIMRTVEHYCGEGLWCQGPPKVVFYSNYAGATIGILATLADD